MARYAIASPLPSSTPPTMSESQCTPERVLATTMNAANAIRAVLASARVPFPFILRLACMAEVEVTATTSSVVDEGYGGGVDLPGGYERQDADAGERLRGAPSSCAPKLRRLIPSKKGHCSQQHRGGYGNRRNDEKYWLCGKERGQGDSDDSAARVHAEHWEECEQQCRAIYESEGRC